MFPRPIPRFATLFLAQWLLLSIPSFAANSAEDCYKAFFALRATTFKEESQIVKSFESNLPVARAFEKEGLLYTDIAHWFDTIDKDLFKKRMTARLKKEKGFSRNGFLLSWLEDYPKRYRPQGSAMKPKEWAEMTPEQQLKYFFSAENPFDLINPKGREQLFYDNVLNFDDVRSSGITPNFLTVGDDLGSYEIRSVASEADRVKYVRDRKQIEDSLESKVGHQHFFHGWPKSKETREKVVGQYLENLDTTSWYLYWRQIRRNPNDAESILFHPYLGVYERDMLDRLADSFVEGVPEKFNQKYRTVGARAFKPREGSETDGWSRLTDFEQRSGNKGEKREFIADVMEARLSTGDYNGLKDFRSYDFDASTPTNKLFAKWLDEGEIAKLEAFEEAFPKLEYSDHARAYNHFRNRVLAPMLPWENRLDIDYKLDVLKRAQKRFAEHYLDLAKTYLRKAKGLDASELSELRGETRSALERLNYLFARRVRLDIDLENYLMPKPTKLPDITVKSDGPIDVNQTPIGIETSHRFPSRPRSKSQAEKQIRLSAEAFAEEIGAVKVERVEDGGHGHGLSIRYLVTDKEGKAWRVEWDGIQRSYDKKGNPINPRGGHIEAPTPKMQPQKMDELAALYRGMRKQGNYPRRSAGGAHYNAGLEQLQELSSEEAAARFANLIRYFEENRELLQFLWQHPSRERVAIPVPYGKKFVNAINKFEGDWIDMAKLLYKQEYFNPYITRKPAYIQMNTTGVMGDVVPEVYKKPIDIKKADKDQWFPSFSKSGVDRIEWRFTDAMTDEYLQALQIKFFRALINRGLNGEKVILNPKNPKTNPLKAWRDNSKQFFADSDDFLISLGLSPDEFRPLQVQAMQQQQLKGDVVDARKVARGSPIIRGARKKHGKHKTEIDEAMDKAGRKERARLRKEMEQGPMERPKKFLPPQKGVERSSKFQFKGEGDATD